MGDENNNNLMVTTLGNFSVMNNQYSLTDEYSGSLKLWELFKYFITYRDELLLPEKIIDSIWPDADYQDPKRTLRALVFRLRKTLNKKGDDVNNSIIIHAHGCYKLDSKKVYWIDVVEFERLYNKAFNISDKNPEEAIRLYKDVIDIYKEGYLSESYEYEWLIPARNYYRRIFLQTICEISGLLKEKDQYKEIIKICQESLKYELFEEEIHYIYIDALQSLGKISQAKNHYEYVADIFSRELGVKPSDALARLYRLLFIKPDQVGYDLLSISDALREKEYISGPLLCDLDYFKFHYQLERRRFERYEQKSFLALVTLLLEDYTLPPSNQLEKEMQQLKCILKSTLRKGDVITKLNKAQIIMNLTGLNIGQIYKALDRVQAKFMKLSNNKELILYRKVEQILPLKE